MSIDPTTFMSTMEKRVNLTAEDKSLLKSEMIWGKEIAPEMAERFYDYLGSDEEMNSIVNATEGRAHRLKETFIEWFSEMFSGMDDWGKTYAERRWKIGLVHVKLGIGPQHVVPAMATVIRAAGERAKVDGKGEQIKDSLGRICMIDLAFIEQAYVEVSSQAVLRETGWTEGLFKRLIATGANDM